MSMMFDVDYERLEQIDLAREAEAESIKDDILQSNYSFSEMLGVICCNDYEASLINEFCYRIATQDDYFDVATEFREHLLDQVNKYADRLALLMIR